MRLYLGALVIALWLMSIPLAAAFAPGDLEWSPAVTGTLNKDGTLSNGDYMVKAVQFPGAVQGRQDVYGNWLPEDDIDPMVYLEVYKKGVLIKEIIMAPGSDPYIDPDYEAKIYATGFMAGNAKEWIYQFYNPWATVAIELRAKPTLTVTVTTDKSAYTSSDDRVMTATVTVKNTGGAIIKNVDVNLNIDELKLEDGRTELLHNNYMSLEKGASQNYSVIISVPKLVSQKSYTLSAEAKGYDVKEILYPISGNLSLTVSPKPMDPPRVTISKSIKNNVYLKDIAYVKITVGNGGTYDVYNIHVNDSMNENFELKTNDSLQWDPSLLKPGQEWSTSYPIKPLSASPTGFTLPAATVQFMYTNITSSISSQTTSVIVNGPKIVLNKTVSKAKVNITEDVTITVSISNAGNIGTSAEVKDTLPVGASLVSGQTSLASTYLEYNKPQGFSYTIRMDTDGNISLPAATARYTDIAWKGTEHAVTSSDMPVITVIDPSKIPPPLPAVATSAGTAVQQTTQSSKPENTPEPTPTPITPGFDIVIAISTLIIVAIRRT